MRDGLSVNSVHEAHAAPLRPGLSQYAWNVVVNQSHSSTCSCFLSFSSTSARTLPIHDADCCRFYHGAGNVKKRIMAQACSYAGMSRVQTSPHTRGAICHLFSAPNSESVTSLQNVTRTSCAIEYCTTLHEMQTGKYQFLSKPPSKLLNSAISTIKYLSAFLSKRSHEVKQSHSNCTKNILRYNNIHYDSVRN